MLQVIDPNRPTTRSLDDIVAMARTTLANLAQLKIADARRRNIDPANHELPIASPGPITKHRDALIDHRTIRDYDDPSLALRIQEFWGRHCLFCWSLHVPDPNQPPAFDPPPKNTANPLELRCDSALSLKQAEIEGFLWRLQTESRARDDRAFAASTEGQAALQFAAQIPVQINNADASNADNNALLATACQYAGMLAAIRWIADARRPWNEPGLMEVRNFNPQA
jgi:hypothetical protein